MEYLNKEDILLINKKTIEKHGGNFVSPFNFLNEPPLDYLLDIVQAKMYGKQLYPEVYEKAGVYMFNTISNHVFQDGNKRTGLGAALIFLQLNGFTLREELQRVIISSSKTIPQKGNTSDDILTEFTLELAAGKISLEECQKWFKENIIEI